MVKLDLKLVRTRETFVSGKKNLGTASNYNSVINNFENFCMEKFGKPDIIEDLKKHTDIEILDVNEPTSILSTEQLVIEYLKEIQDSEKYKVSPLTQEIRERF